MKYVKRFFDVYVGEENIMACLLIDLFNNSYKDIDYKSGKFAFPDSNAAQIKKLEAVCIIDRWEF